MSDLALDHLLANQAVVREHALSRIEYLCRTIAEIEVRTSALASVVANLS